MKILTILLMCTYLISACAVPETTIHTEHVNDSISYVTVTHPKKILLLPIQESQEEVKVKLLRDADTDVYMDIRLAVDSVDYFVPLATNSNTNKIVIEVVGLASDALTWENLKAVDEFDTSSKDYFRPHFHHAPEYGWMNDPNGLFYKDGYYHLYYQFNPYGSTWGNMHWGHAVSRDLIHWTPKPIAIERDTLGHIFSGNCVVDYENLAGFGEGAVLAYYTAHKWITPTEYQQVQCVAYSTDDGLTFKKYEQNPILKPADGISDFRDPKVFWYEPTQTWYMIVSADTEMRFFSSQNLIDWTYVSSFGEGWGVQPNQFECPDFVELPLDGNLDQKRWVMIVNINPGGLFGGSATEYFVGTFDGKSFIPDTPPHTTKWLDFGKDHYAFVTFHNLPNRVVGIPWVSNWQYANITPFKQSRGVNGLPRELFLFSKDEQLFVGSKPEDLEILRKNHQQWEHLVVSDEYTLSDVLDEEKGANEIFLEIESQGSSLVGIELFNEQAEKVTIYLDFKSQRLVMDRTQSGYTHFGENSTIHHIENHDRRKTNAHNYQNDFSLATWAPLSLLDGPKYNLHIVMDKSIIEIFADGGRIAMTNLVFPTTPYKHIKLLSQHGQANVSNVHIYHLELNN